MQQTLTEEEAETLYLKAGEVTPIRTRELFAGRLEQLAKVADAVFQKGLHVVLYGERGVGKTSLANMIPGVLESVGVGCGKAVDAVLETTKTQYHEATRSGRKDALFDQVILACAMAPKDELSYFQPADIAAPMSSIMGKPYGIPSFAKHLNAFCDKGRGKILERTGVTRRYRYRFTDPLMEPYVVMRGLKTGLVSSDVLDEFTGDSRRR